MSSRSSSFKVIASLAAVAAVFAVLRARTPTPRRAILTHDANVQIQARVGAVVARPEVQRAFSDVFDAVAADPETAKVLGALTARLGADPDIAAGLAALGDALVRDPAVTKGVQAFAQAHPDLADDAFGAAFSAELQARFTAHGNGGRGFRELVRGLDLDADAAQFVARLGHLRELTASLDASSDVQAWEDRVVALNGGTVPDPDRANEILLSHAFADARVATLLTTILRDPVFRDGVRAVVRVALTTPAVQDALVAGTRRLVSSPAVRARVIAAFAVLAGPDPAPASVAAAIDALVRDPDLREAARAAGIAALRAPAIARAADDAIGALVAAPTIRRAATAFRDEW